MPVILMIPTFNDGVHSVQKLENLAIQIQELVLRLHKLYTVIQNFTLSFSKKLILSSEPKLEVKGLNHFIT